MEHLAMMTMGSLPILAGLAVARVRSERVATLERLAYRAGHEHGYLSRAKHYEGDES